MPKYQAIATLASRYMMGRRDKIVGRVNGENCTIGFSDATEISPQGQHGVLTAEPIPDDPGFRGADGFDRATNEEQSTLDGLPWQMI